MDSDVRYSLRLLLLAALLAVFPCTVEAQTVRVQNDATVRVQNDASWDLQGGTMDFGSPGATARLDEQGSARVANGQLMTTRSLNNPSGADPAGLGLQITASVNLGNVTVTRGHTAQTGNGNSSIERYYDVSPSQNNSGLSAELTVSYNDAELNGLTESDLEFFKSTNGGMSWSEEGFDSRDAQNNAVTLGGIESLSRWTLGSEDQPLPVELAAFEGTTTKSGVTLTWQTTAETNNAGFEVQRRTAATAEAAWNEVGFVESNAEGGTSTEATTYRFADKDLPYAADELEYRLRQVDVDGSETLTDPVEIERAVEQLELRKTFPNPASGQATVQFAVPGRQDVALRLYDVLGRQVRTVQQGALEGRQELQVDLSGLPSGTYFVRLRAEDHVRTQRLTVVR
jgi:hypothetical protein